MKQEIPALTGCILLEKAVIDWDVFRLQFFDDWHVEIEGEAVPEQLSFEINGAQVLCVLENTPVQAAIDNAFRNYSWQNAIGAISQHTAHVELYLLDCENPLQRHVLFTMIASSLLKQEGTIGIYQYPVTRRAIDYIEGSQRMMKDELPVLDWVYIGLYQSADGLWNAYTYGLEDFNKPELEILNTEAGLIPMYQFLAQTVISIVSGMLSVVPGEPLALDAERTCIPTLSEAAAIDGETIKIAF